MFAASPVAPNSLTPPAAGAPPCSAATAALAFVGVHKAYRAGVPGCSATARVLRDVQLTVIPGELVGIAGAAGAGKSTLLLCAAGLLRPDHGHVSWGGNAPPGGAPGAAYVTAPARPGTAAAEIGAGPHPAAVQPAALLRETSARRALEGARECRALARVIAGGTTLLLLDDAPAVLGGRAAGLMRSLADLGVAVVAAARDPVWLERAGARTLTLVHGALVGGARGERARRPASSPLSAESARPRG